jgi:RNA-splicing ligase RtcB
MGMLTSEPAAVSPDTEAQLRVFESEEAPADLAAIEGLHERLADADLAAPAVVLPDFHQKPNMEAPSSLAVATLDTVRPTLTSASVNCGMALVALGIERPTLDSITEFYRRARTAHPFPPTYRRDLTRDEVVRCAAHGGRFAVERFDVDPEVLAQVEERGHVDVERFGGIERARRELPWSVQQLSRIRFATIGPSNHFVELQEVEELLDPDAAALLGLEVGQVTMQYHGGGGSLPGELGLLYGRRKRYPRPVRMQMAVQKPLFHLAGSRSWQELKLRRRLYFSRDYPPVDRHGREGERLLLANAMAMNYGFAFRVAAYSWLSRLAHECLGSPQPRLVVDSPHNSIYEEEVDGRSALVHRHNAARVYTAAELPDHPVFGKIGQPLLLPGTNRTSSYVCIPGERAEESLRSVCHGAGSTIKSLVGRGLSGPDPEGRITHRFGYAQEHPTEVEQLDDRGVDAALTILADERVVRPVARLRPFAVLN